MEYLVDSRIMKSIDTFSIREIGIPSVVLMERAALGVSALIMKLAEDEADGRLKHKVLCVCGSGNNGADGLAVARQLYERGLDVRVALAGSSEGTEEYRLQKSIVRDIGVEVSDCVNNIDFAEYDYIVDAIFGIGLSRDIEGSYAEIVEAINAAGKNPGVKVVAVDIASGINADNGAVMGCAVKADYTVTFGYRKIGNMLFPGANHSGHVIAANAGFAPESMLTGNIDGFGSMFTYSDEDIARLVVRKSDSNKGTYGKVLICAGSELVGGAAVLSGEAAYRCGTGLVKLYTHEINREAILGRIPECLISAYGVQACADGSYIEQLNADIKWSGCVAAGPGLSTDSTAKSIVETVLAADDKVRVLDADALNIIARDAIHFEGSTAGPIIVTPHLMEMSRLTGKSVTNIKNSLIDCAVEYAKEHRCICVLKDSRTVVTDCSRVYVNSSGNNGMSTGGSGDVLTGIIAGLAAQGISAYEAACIGVYIHGRAGDAAEDRLGACSMTAGDIALSIAEVLKKAL